MKQKEKISLFLGLIVSFTMQAQKSLKGRAYFDSIPNQDAFTTSSSLNPELLSFFKSAYDLTTVEKSSGALIWNCRKTISGKSYWHKAEGKASYGLNFSCKKDKTPFMVSNFRNPKVGEKDDALIEVYSSVSEPLFKDNDFINQKAKRILKRFGKSFIKRGNYIVYHNYIDKILVLYFSEDRVAFFRYAWLNKPITRFSEIDEGLLKLK